MLREWLESLFTPCSPQARREGFLKEAIAIEARYRRCRAAWQPHLEQSRRVMEQAAAQCIRKHRLVILGSGALLDIPLESLANQFAEIYLVDRVHPLRTRRKVRSFAHVRLIEADIIHTLPHAEVADMTISANLLSQLPILPALAMRRCGTPPEIVEARVRAIIEQHLHMLAQLPGDYLLLTDITRRCTDRQGNELLREDALHGVPLPSPPIARWEWRIAPDGEIARNQAWMHEVVAVASHRAG